MDLIVTSFFIKNYQMKKINYYLFTSILLVLWIDYIPYKLPSLIENSKKFEFLIYNLSLAYIAGYMFYYINTYLPERRNSKIIKRVINNNVMFIIEKRKILNDLKNQNIDDKYQLEFRGKNIFIEDFLKKNQVNLHHNLDSILIIKERLPTELLNCTLLLKKHPYFKSNFTNLKKLNEYIESYVLLSTKLHDEFKKL